MTTTGHNSGAVDAGHLQAFIERIERLEESKREIADDIKEVYAEAKGTGYDTKTMRAVIKLRALSVDERAEQEALLDIYKAALGMLDGTPLGEAAVAGVKSKSSFSGRAIADAARAMGKPVPLTDDEKAKGYSAAFVGKDGERMTLGVNLGS